MPEYAPKAIRLLADRVVADIPSARLAGILGDSTHTSGYHRARNALSANDHSVQTGPDRQGDGWAASAVDFKFNATWMTRVTGRLLASARDEDDPRLNFIREFFGTLDGIHVTGWDTFYNRPATAGSGHLWHVHISILRKYANSNTAMNALYSVLIGESLEDYDMPTVKEIWTTDGLIDAPADAPDADRNPHWRPNNAITGILDRVYHLREEIQAIKSEQAAARTRDEQLLEAVRELTSRLDGG